MPAAAEPSTLTLPALGTFATVLVTGPDALGPAHQVLAAELAAMDAACSRFRRDSELWRVNHAAAARSRSARCSRTRWPSRWTRPNSPTETWIPTCGQSLVRLGYDRDFALARRHAGPLRQPPMPAGGWRRVELDRGHPAVRVPAGILLDLGATAKALAADRAAAAIQAAWAAASWSTWAVTSGWRGSAGRRLAGRYRRRRRLRHQHRQRQAPPGGHDQRRRPGHVEPARPRLAARRAPAASHRRPGYRQARPILLAHGQRRRRELRRREHRQHRGDPARRAGDRVAGRAAACPPASSGTTARSSPWPAGRR